MIDANKAKAVADQVAPIGEKRVQTALADVLKLIDGASKRGRRQILDPSPIMHPPLNAEDREAFHDALKARGFKLVEQKSKETAITWS